jgi:hypothetical protein
MIRINKQKSKPEPEPNPSLSKTSRATPSSDLIQQHPKKTLAKQKLWHNSSITQVYSPASAFADDICTLADWDTALLQNWTIGCSKCLCLQLRQVCSQMGELGVLICACKLRQVRSKDGQLGSVLVCACRLTQVCCIIRQLGVDGSCQMAQQQTTGRERHAHTQPHIHVEWASRRARNERGCIPYACLGCKRLFAQISAFLNPKPSMCKTKV